MQNFRLVTTRIIIHQIPKRTKSKFLFKHWITLVSSKTLYALEKTSQSQCIFSDLWLLAWKLTKFLMPFFKSWAILSFTNDGILLSKVENEFSLKKWSLKWGMMQNFKRNWLVVSKLPTAFDEVWPEHWIVSKICTLMGYFWANYMF